jgi:hypothetical protein
MFASYSFRSILRTWVSGVPCEAGSANHSLPTFCGIRVARHVGACVMFCRSLFVLDLCIACPSCRLVCLYFEFDSALDAILDIKDNNTGNQEAIILIIILHSLYYRSQITLYIQIILQCQTNRKQP